MNINDIETISGSVTGEESGQTYDYTFKVRTLLTREQRFIADQVRREILGPNPNDALAQLQFEAFTLGQLAVRIVDPPEWWKAAGLGRGLKDLNVISAIYNAALAKETERKDALKKKADAALEKLASTPIQSDENVNPTPKKQNKQTAP